MLKSNLKTQNAQHAITHNKGETLKINQTTKKLITINETRQKENRKRKTNRKK